MSPSKKIPAIKKKKLFWQFNYVDLSKFYFKVVQRMRTKQANLKVDLLLVTRIEKRVFR